MKAFENFVDDLWLFDAAMPARDDGFGAGAEVRASVGDDSVAAFQQRMISHTTDDAVMRDWDGFAVECSKIGVLGGKCAGTEKGKHAPVADLGIEGVTVAGKDFFDQEERVDG